MAVSYLTIQPTRTLTLAPVVGDPVGTHTMRLYVKFTGAADYVADDYYEFDVTIAACVTTSVTNVAITNKSYVVSGAEIPFTHGVFTQEPAC